MTPRSPNFDRRSNGASIDMLILHYTGMRSSIEASERLCDPSAKVSAHYLIDEDGQTLALVAEEQRAWHAGVGGWRGRRSLNDVSIGIELVNPGHAWGYRPFPEPQMTALIKLIDDIRKRWPIDPRRVLAHSDIAPSRKQDPGELFDWPTLNRAGHAALPSPTDPRLKRDDNVTQLLEDIGYDFGLASIGDILRAFQRHFLPHQLDAGLTRQTIDTILAVHGLFAEAPALK